MARFGDWKSLVPEKIADYLEKNNLVQRFQREFGLETLALLSNGIILQENLDDEMKHAREAIR